ncbi:MAG: HD domain-containing protein [Bacteroidetes bacterium]|nr:HD domain-containing protein [Bacteroidota bacterium]
MKLNDLTSRFESWIAGVSENHDTGHDINHLRRVMRNAAIIAEGEGYKDHDLISLCALFHDVADHKFTGNPDILLEKVAAFLHGEGVHDDYISKVKFVAEHVSFSKRSDRITKTPELEIVMDADRLDAIGAVGIARAFTYGGFRSRPLYGEAMNGTTIGHFYEKLLLLRDLMNTGTAKKMAQERHNFMVQFLEQFERETGVEPATLSLGS